MKRQIATILIPIVILAALSAALKLVPWWGSFDIFFTALVLVGVCMEVEPLVKFFCRIKRDERLDSYNVRIARWKHPGEAFLILGLAGEIVCLGISLNESAKLNAKAEEAHRQAGFANERASSNEKQVVKLTNQTLQLSIALEQSKSNELALEFFSRRPRWQRFDSAKMIDFLKGRPGVPVEILYDGQDDDSEQIAGRLTFVLWQIGWQTTRTRAASESDIIPGWDWMRAQIIAGVPKTLIGRTGAVFGGFGIIRQSKSSDTNGVKIESAMNALAAGLEVADMPFHDIKVFPGENSNMPPGILRLVIPLERDK